MITKLKCWLGWHEWDNYVNITIPKEGVLFSEWNELFKIGEPQKLCKKCGKVKP